MNLEVYYNIFALLFVENAVLSRESSGTKIRWYVVNRFSHGRVSSSKMDDWAKWDEFYWPTSFGQ